MRLTVGPLPAAVYWRRRGVVLIGLGMIVLVISYACGGAGGSTAGAGTQPPMTSSQPTPTTTLLRPVVPTASPKPTAFTLPTTAATGPCADAEVEVTALAAAAEVQVGQPVDFTIKIKNVSGRTCSRDIGADMQELRLTDGSVVIWSSDDCSPNKGHDVRSFGAGREVSFTLRWTGRRSRTGAGATTCVANASPPAPSMYQLVARLDLKYSAPFPLQVKA